MHPVAASAERFKHRPGLGGVRGFPERPPVEVDHRIGGENAPSRLGDAPSGLGDAPSRLGDGGERFVVGEPCGQTGRGLAGPWRLVHLDVEGRERDPEPPEHPLSARRPGGQDQWVWCQHSR